MAGRPLKELGDKTTLEAAKTPVMDRLAKTAELGMVQNVPEGMKAGSDIANLSVLGYDPKKYYTGRSPLEALSIGVSMKPGDIAFRCNLVTLSEEESTYEERHILDHSSDEISTEDADILVQALKETVLPEGFQLYTGTSYRHLLIHEHGEVTELVPPHDVLTRVIGGYLPEDEYLREMMKKSYEVLNHHPLNEERRRLGLHPANSMWFWGAGTRPALDSFEEKIGKRGIMISAVDLLKGIAVGADMGLAIVPGANGGLHTNYEGKAEAAVDALLKDGYDFAYVHVEAPDEMGHQGKMMDKVQSIEYLDSRVIGKIVEKLDKSGEDYRILVLPDHPTPICARTHTNDPVPYLLYDSRSDAEGALGYSEKTAMASNRRWQQGHELILHLLND